jgi:hypothetical protein
MSNHVFLGDLLGTSRLGGIFDERGGYIVSLETCLDNLCHFFSWSLDIAVNQAVFDKKKGE